MSDRDAFVAARRGRWARLDQLLARDRPTSAQWSEIASLYRAICADLARAQAIGLGDDVRTYLDGLAGRAHNRLYGVRDAGGLQIARLIASEVPREVRASWRPFLAANLLFYGPMLIGIVGSLVDARFAPSVLPPEQLEMMERMYRDPELVRAAGEDASMAGFYVFNNVGIAFRCFATGALVGLGSAFFLVYNGLVLGTVKGYLTSVGVGDNLLAFIAGHGPWELTGIVLAGAAGLRMGWAMIETGGRTRAGSLKAAAPGLFRLVLGAAVLLLVAAVIEGFWSAGPVPPVGKYVFGAVQIGIIAAWLAFGGRERPRSAEPRDPPVLEPIVEAGSAKAKAAGGGA